jgi:hypothetical protein
LVTDDYIALVTRNCDEQDLGILRSFVAPTPIIHSLWAYTKFYWNRTLKKLKNSSNNSNESTYITSLSPKSSQPSDKTAAPEQENWTLNLPLPTNDKDLLLANKIFKETARVKRNKNLSNSAPRGCVVFSGMIEFVGSRGFATFDIRALYDLKSSSFVKLDGRIRRVQEKHQRPKGGP